MLWVVSGDGKVTVTSRATGRRVGIDDVILNVVGGVAGWFAGLMILRLVEAVVPSALDDGDEPATARPCRYGSRLTMWNATLVWAQVADLRL